MKVTKEMLGYLREKGVSSDILIGMLLEEDPAPEQQSGPEPEAPAPEAREEPRPEPKPAVDPVLEAINRLTGIIQTQNIRGRGVDAVPQQSTDDILAYALGGKKDA